MAILDVLDKKGADTVAEFCQRFGEAMAVYIHCDVASAEQRSSKLLKKNI